MKTQTHWIRIFKGKQDELIGRLCEGDEKGKIALLNAELKKVVSEGDFVLVDSWYQKEKHIDVQPHSARVPHGGAATHPSCVGYTEALYVADPFVFKVKTLDEAKEANKVIYDRAKSDWKNWAGVGSIRRDIVHFRHGNVIDTGLTVRGFAIFVRKDCNRHYVDGKWVEAWNLWLATNDFLPKGEENEYPFERDEKHGDHSLFITTYPNGIVSFGLEVEKGKPGHGGRWSSNPESVYLRTGLIVQEVSITYRSNYDGQIHQNGVIHCTDELWLEVAKELTYRFDIKTGFYHNENSRMLVAK